MKVTRITARIEFASKRRPKNLIVRLRHPKKNSLRSVTVNGADWDGFDTVKEWVRITRPRCSGPIQ